MNHRGFAPAGLPIMLHFFAGRRHIDNPVAWHLRQTMMIFASAIQ